MSSDFSAQQLTVLLLSFFIIHYADLPANAYKSIENSVPAPEKQATELADDTIIITLAPHADMDKVEAVIGEVHGTVVNKLHIEKEDYWILFVKPEADKEDETIERLLSKSDKNFRAITRNKLLKPLAP